MSQHRPPHPTPDVARRVEELLHEVLRELGVNPKDLQPQEIAANMVCQIGYDNSMLYSWKGQPILHVVPEINDAGGERNILWRMFTAEDMED